jgi:tRNA nucleotidyltransferase (CCA-adding enzyme)
MVEKIGAVLQEVIEEFSLSKEETKRIENLAKDFVAKLKKHGLNAVVGGSLAKGTLIRKDLQDADIFVIFKNEEDTLKLEGVLEKIGMRFDVVKGSRDYFHVKLPGEKVIFEIIPVVKLEKVSEAKNITDYSLSHVRYVVKELKKHKKLADEIKLAKIFCHAQDCYGAESYIQGFSGYALELLIIYFGGFVNFLKGIAKKRVIDVKKQFKNEKEVMSELNESKLISPVILIDPVYKFRNATASLSKETFERFLTIANNFMKKPSAEFFQKKQLDLDGMIRRAERKKVLFLDITFRTDKQEGDIAGTKMKKFFNFLISQLENKEQKVFEKVFVYNGDGQEAKAYVILKEIKEIEARGPPRKNKVAVKNFQKAHKKVYFKKGFAYVKRKVSLDEIFANVKSFEQEMNVQFEIIK